MPQVGLILGIGDRQLEEVGRHVVVVGVEHRPQDRPRAEADEQGLDITHQTEVAHDELHHPIGAVRPHRSIGDHRAVAGEDRTEERADAGFVTLEHPRRDTHVTPGRMPQASGLQPQLELLVAGDRADFLAITLARREGRGEVLPAHDLDDVRLDQRIVGAELRGDLLHARIGAATDDAGRDHVTGEGEVVDRVAGRVGDVILAH